ncbi:hypothetical protein SAMN05443544_0541 [Agromyces cerinus subsp. cerinus]|uniref:Uncharacterized protein n=2 Tax=Agromyces cerinus TaxID=33878 RepID=A0A1N6DPB4_9MICO|nr:hypothetical protein SAMN05443544_0541 [Agromyces cerinus subsp. cerinus]
MTEVSGIDTPVSEEEIWGVELDDWGSVDYAESFGEALTYALQSGGRLVRVRTEFFEVGES